MQSQSIAKAHQHQDMLLAWQEQLAQAACNLSLKQELIHTQDEVLPQFAAHYAKLKALPRQMRRSIQRKWKQTLAGVALLLTLGQTPAMAAVINVGGTCTLVKAVTTANTDAAVPGCIKGSGADTIRLPTNSVQTLTAGINSPYGANGLPVIRGSLTIAGNGSTIKRAANAVPFRILAVGDSSSLTLQRTTVSGGIARNASGGGVYSQYGNLALTNSTISGNFATNSGGGVGMHGGHLSVTNSTISGNSTRYGGGGLEVDRFATGTILASTIAGNSATSRGGGGIHLGSHSSLALTNSTISGNVASPAGGGVYVDYNGRLSLTNSTVTRNSATRGSGAYVWENGVLDLNRTLISGNVLPPGSNPIVNGREVCARSTNYGSGTVNAANYNVFGHGSIAGISGFSRGLNDIVPKQPLSSVLNTTLASNGGPTRTHALVGGSQAIDAVINGTCPLVKDQRGVTRPRDGNGDGGVACDTGSVER